MAEYYLRNVESTVYILGISLKHYVSALQY
jgi:hypothetical protein